jgi:hypothetical protein
MGAETPFFQTRMGHTFYNANVPRIAKALERIAEAMEAQARPSAADQADDAIKASRFDRIVQVFKDEAGEFRSGADVIDAVTAILSEDV